MKKFTALLLALVFMAAVFASPAGAVGFEPPFEISSKAAYIVNTDTNIIVYEKNSEESLPAASTTKLMTAILVMEQYQDQLDTVTGESSAYIRDTIYTFVWSTAPWPMRISDWASPTRCAACCTPAWCPAPPMPP